MAGAIVAALVAFGLLLSRVAPERAHDFGDEARILPVPRAIGEFSLVDHEGRVFDRARLEGQWSLLFFGYTYCPDVCPIVLQNLKQVVSLARSRGELEELPQVVMVSVDPERDTPERMAEYVAFFDPAYTGVSGPQAELEPLARAVGAFYRIGDKRDGAADYLVDHSSTLFLVDPSAHFFALLEDPHDPQEFLELLAAVKSVGLDRAVGEVE